MFKTVEEAQALVARTKVGRCPICGASAQAIVGSPNQFGHIHVAIECCGDDFSDGAITYCCGAQLRAIGADAYMTQLMRWNRKNVAQPEAKNGNS